MSGFLVIDTYDFSSIFSEARCHKCDFISTCRNADECMFPIFWDAEKRATPLYQMCDKDGKLVEPYRSLILEEKDEFDAR